MNILKNFEAVFVVAVGVAACTSYFVQSADATANAAAKADSAAGTMSSMSIATPSRMAVVSVVGKRMSAIEKQRSLEDERRLAKSGAANGERL
jgi:hypothetical protein